MIKTTTQERTSALSGLPRNVWVVSVTSFLTDISSEMIINLLPLFLASVLGVKTGIIGLIEGVAETTASLLKVVSGWLSDRLGQRKWLAVAGYGLSTLVKPLFYFVTSWWGVLTLRFADRVGKGIRTAPRDALVADSISQEHRGLAFGLHRAADTGGAMIGLLVALGVVWAAQSGAVGLERSTFQVVVLISFLPAALAVLTLAVGAQDVRADRDRDSRGGEGGAEARPEPSRKATGLDVVRGPFRAFLFIVVLFTLGNSSDAFLILRAQERGLSVAGILAMVATFNGVYALVSGPAGALSDRVGRRWLIIAGWLMYGLVYLGFALVRSGWQVWALYAIYGVYYGMVEGTAKALVADLVAPEQRGTGYGVYNAVVGLMALPASLIAGMLWQGVGGWDGFGPSAPFLFGAALALTAAGLMWWWLPAYGSDAR
jgi:MFS family permease